MHHRNKQGTLLENYKHFRKAAIKRMATPYLPDHDSLVYWRARVLFTALTASLFLGTFALAAAFALAFKEDTWALALFDSLGYVIFIVLIFSRTIRYEIRAGTALIICYAIGVFVILSVGPISGGPFYLFGFVVLTGVLLGSKPALGAVCLNLVTILILTWLSASGRLGPEFPGFKTPQALVAAGVSFIALNAVVAFCVSLLVKGLVSTYRKEESLALRLNQEREQLFEAKSSLEKEVSERIQAEQALRQSEEKYRHLFEMESDAIFLIDKISGRIMEVNASASAMYGYSRPELLTMYNTDLSAEPDKTTQATREEQVQIPIRYHRRKDGTVFPVEITASHLVWKGSAAHIAAIRDISKRIQIEKQRAKLEKELFHVYKMESIGTLAGGIAHDFNNLLFPIMGLSEILLDDLPKDSSEWADVAEILNSAKRARDLVNQILSFSRQAETKPIPIEPRMILKEAVKLARATIPRNIEITSHLENAVGPVMVDPTHLHQIAMNLITNAYHAVEESGGAISIGLTEKSINPQTRPVESLELGKYAVFIFTDTGCGIDPVVLDRIFDPYFTTKKIDKGTGIGLSVVYGLVKDYGGEIIVHSEVGKGSTFEIFLPVIEGAAIDTVPERPEDIPKGSEHILLVDDEATVLKAEKKTFERLGYRVTQQTSSIEALDLFKSDPHQFDLVFTDMAMPVMTGEQLTREIRKLRPDMPIIICTGFSHHLTTEKASVLGISGILMKPVIRKDMARMVREVLDKALA